MKNVLLIGLGRFGRHMAQTLSDLHHQVLAIDKDEHRIQEAMAYVTNAEIGDATDPALIDALGVRDFDLCVVTMSHDLQASLEITALLKKKGAQFVLARVSRDTHGQFLLSCGADEIIYPEKQMAEWAAVRYTGDHVYDYTRYRLNILAIRRDGKVDPMPSPSSQFVRGDHIVLLGSDKDVQKFLRF